MQLLGRGRAADVFLLEDGRVLKRDREGRSAEYEADAMRHAAAHGFPVPRVFSAKGTDLVTERINGPTMTAALARVLLSSAGSSTGQMPVAAVPRTTLPWRG